MSAEVAIRFVYRNGKAEPCEFDRPLWLVPICRPPSLDFAWYREPFYEQVEVRVFVAHQFVGDPGKRVFAVLEDADARPLATVPVTVYDGRQVAVALYLPDGEKPAECHCAALAEAYW